MTTERIPVSFYPVVDLLVETNLASSRSEAARLIKQGAVEKDGEPVEWLGSKVSLCFKDGTILRVGKHKWLKIQVDEQNANVILHVNRQAGTIRFEIIK